MRAYEIDDNDRALVTGFVASEDVRRRWERDVGSFRERVGRNRGREYLDRFSDTRRSLDMDALERKALSIGHKVRSAFRDDVLAILNNIADFQHASRCNQDFMLADPYVNYKARNGHISGWGRDVKDYAYRDDEDPASSPFYRSMYDGVLRVNPENDKHMYAESFLGQTENDQPKLSFSEQMAMVRNTELIRSLLLENDADPTSQLNNKM